MGDRQSDDADEVREVFDATPVERSMEQAAAVASMIPVFGGLATEFLNRERSDRRERRLQAFLDVLARRVETHRERLEALAAEAADFVRSEDFQELVSDTFDAAAEERDEEKRQLYANFLLGLIETPGAVDDRFKVLKVLRDVTALEIIVLKAVREQPPPLPALSNTFGSPTHTLMQRTSLSAADVKEAVDDLNSKRITDLRNLNTTMTGRGAAELESTLTRFGQRFVEFVLTDPTQ